MDYTHFYGSCRTKVYSFGWYYQEVRVVRRDPAIRSVGDAQGFRRNREKLRVSKNSGGRYFHYGYALDAICQEFVRRKTRLRSFYIS